MNEKFKLVLIGESGVGKTSIARKWLTNTFAEDQIPTIGTAFLKTSFIFRGQERIVQVWDTAGQERYRSLAPIYTKDAFAAVIVFDRTSKETFLNLDEWLKQVNQEECFCILCGNKSDMKNICVSEEEAIQFATERNIEYFNTSAKTGIGISEAFESLLYKAFVKREEAAVYGRTSLTRKVDKSSKKGCC